MSIHDRIRSLDPHVAEALVDAEVTDLDDEGRTLFDVAIAADHRPAIETLARRAEARTFFAPCPKRLRQPIRFELSEGVAVGATAERETRLLERFGPDVRWERTPLLEACRRDHRFAIEALLAAGAKTGEKDLLGTTDLDLCFEHGAAEFFVDTCRRHRVKLRVGERTLESLIGAPTWLDRLEREAKLGVAAERWLLALHCARLDVERVDRMLGRVDVNRAHGPRAHPLLEACTSHLLWAHERWEELALFFRFGQVMGAPGTHALQFEPGGYGEALRQQREKRERFAAFEMDDATMTAQFERRLLLVDRLRAAGLDVAKVEKKAPHGFVTHLLAMRSDALLERLFGLGFALPLPPHEAELVDPEDRARLARVRR